MKFYETIEKYQDKQIDLYIDMDGVIAEYDLGNFDYSTIRPLQTIIKKIENLQTNSNIHMRILSVCKKTSIIAEKVTWLKKYMPFFPQEDLIFISKEEKVNSGKTSSELKSEYLKKTNSQNIKILIDDDHRIIKFIKENNPDTIIFHVSSWID